MSSETSELPEPELCSSTTRKWWVLVVRDSLQQGTEVPIYQPAYRDVLLTRVSDLRCYGEAAKACPALTLLPPALLFPVGIDNTARGDPEHIKCDFMALDAKGISMGAEWSSAGEGKVLEGEQMQPAGQKLVVQLVSIRILLLTFYDCGTLFKDQGQL